MMTLETIVERADNARTATAALHLLDKYFRGWEGDVVESQYVSKEWNIPLYTRDDKLLNADRAWINVLFFVVNLPGWEGRHSQQVFLREKMWNADTNHPEEMRYTIETHDFRPKEGNENDFS